MILPIFVAILFVYRERWVRIVGELALGLGLLAQVGFYTRAGWLGHIAQVVAYGLVSGRRQVVLALIGIVSLAGIAFIVIPKTGHQTDTVDPWTLEARVVVWTGAKGCRRAPSRGDRVWE